jgi:flagellar basal body-associated protein FliL
VTTSNCIIKLWCNFTDKAQLIDNTSVEPPGLAESPKTKQEKPANLVNDKFNYFRSNVTTTLINYETTVTPGNKGGSKYLVSKITVNPTKLITKNEIISSSLRPKSGSNKSVPDETNDSVHKVEDDLTNNRKLIVIIVLIVILCLMVTLVGTLYFFKRCHQKNNNDNKIDSREEIMLMPVPSQESQANIKIESLENYLKKTMVSSRNIENQFFSFQETVTKSCAIALESKNINKNKDKTFIPYDSTRVILRPLEGMGTDDYINATYINGYDRPKTYITCPGPKYSTIKDFWRLIWQEKNRNHCNGNEFYRK